METRLADARDLEHAQTPETPFYASGGAKGATCPAARRRASVSSGSRLGSDYSGHRRYVFAVKPNHLQKTGCVCRQGCGGVGPSRRRGGCQPARDTPWCLLLGVVVTGVLLAPENLSIAAGPKHRPKLVTSEVIESGLDIPIMSSATTTIIPASHSQTCDTFWAAAWTAHRTGCGTVFFVGLDVACPVPAALIMEH